MKKIIAGALLATTLISAFAFKMAYEPKKSTAEVEQVEGYYIFLQSKPTMEYEFLGDVKGSALTWSGDPKTLFHNMINRAKKDYPKADGIIFHDVELRKCDAIKFK